MNEFTNWTEILYNSFYKFLEQATAVFPKLVGAILILFFGWLFSKLLAAIVARLLKTMKFDELAERFKVSEYLEKASIAAPPSRLLGKFIYWILLLFTFITASDALGWESVSQQLNRLLIFLPNLFMALLFFVVGTYIAGMIRDLIKGTTASIGISTGKMISNLVFYFLFVVVSITALEQAGLDTTLITSNLLLILGTIFIAAAISYGFASRDLLANILAGFFSKRTFAEGQTISVNGVQGKIIEMTNISVTLLSTEEEKVRIVIPTHELLVSKVKIIG
ncbi:MAG: hypothetical protein AAF985_03570 [Bacteroidota bacterium]